MELLNIRNRRYLGNKYKLLPFIKKVVKDQCAHVDTFFDVFAGTGSVASAFTSSKLIVNDIMRCNYITALAWFSCEDVNVKKVRSWLAYFNNYDYTGESNYFNENFANTYFSEYVCKKIGFVREAADTLLNGKELTKREWAVLLTSLFYAMDSSAATCGHYDSYIRNTKLTDTMELKMLDLSYSLSKHNKCLNADANDIAGDYDCDVAYLDPPYNSRQYCDAYHVLENVARWEKPEVFGVAKKMDRTGLKSVYCQAKAAESLEDLVSKLKAGYIVLSYNNNGNKLQSRSNAKISDSDIMRILSKRGNVKVFTQDYRPFSAGKGENEGNQERLFICDVRN